MKSILSSPITIADGNPDVLLTIPSVPAGKYRFVWVTIYNSLSGNGNNGQLSIGFGDSMNMASLFDGGGCASQCATLSPDGSSLNGIVNPLNSGIPAIVTQANTTCPLNSQVSMQTGVILVKENADVPLYYAAGQFDPTDNQVITDAVLILEPLTD